MMTMDERDDIKPLSPVGITADALNATQRDLLMKLIDVYTGYDGARHRGRASWRS